MSAQPDYLFTRRCSLWNGKYGYITKVAAEPKTENGAHYRYLSTTLKIRNRSGRRGDSYTFRGIGDNLDDAIAMAKKMERVMDRLYNMAKAKKMDWENGTLALVAERARNIPYRASVTTRDDSFDEGPDNITDDPADLPDFLNEAPKKDTSTDSSFADGAMFGMLLAKYGKDELFDMAKRLGF